MSVISGQQTWASHKTVCGECRSDVSHVEGRIGAAAVLRPCGHGNHLLIVPVEIPAA